MVSVVAFFIVGLSVILSYNWTNEPGQSKFNATTILFGLLVAGMICAAFSAVRLPAFRARSCPACGRQIPSDANLCPYCGHRFS